MWAFPQGCLWHGSWLEHSFKSVFCVLRNFSVTIFSFPHSMTCFSNLVTPKYTKVHWNLIFCDHTVFFIFLCFCMSSTCARNALYMITSQSFFKNMLQYHLLPSPSRIIVYFFFPISSTQEILFLLLQTLHHSWPLNIMGFRVPTCMQLKSAYCCLCLKKERNWWITNLKIRSWNSLDR